MRAGEGLNLQKFKEIFSQVNADERRHLTFVNVGPCLSGAKAVEYILNHNRLDKKLEPAERAAFDHVMRILLLYRMDREWEPDIILKIFASLDRIFFGGCLRGHVLVQWTDENDPILKSSHPNTVVFGVTVTSENPNKCQIKLNASAIFARSRWEPFLEMCTTMLHEMCHAFQVVRFKDRVRDHLEGHNVHWYHTMKAIHLRSMAQFRMEVITAETKLARWWKTMKAEVKKIERGKMRREIEDEIAREEKKKKRSEEEEEARKRKERKGREGRHERIDYGAYGRYGR